MKNTAIACGAYQFNDSEKQQLWGIVLDIRLPQKTQVFLKEWKILFVCLFLKGIFKHTPGQILGNKAKQTAFRLKPVQNIIYNKMKLGSEAGNMGCFQSIPGFRKKLASLMRNQFVPNIIFIFEKLFFLSVFIIDNTSSSLGPSNSIGKLNFLHICKKLS